jgi:CRP/FNR family transcriptional regulator, nitrogen oxide reductase regulator
MQYALKHANADAFHRMPAGELFRGFSEEQKGIIFSAGVVRRYGPRSVIIRADEPALHLFYLQAGHVNFHRVAEDGRQILLGRLVPTDVFGLGSFVADGIRYIGTAETVNDSEVVVWERAHVRRLAATYSLLAENAFRIVLHYVSHFAKRHISLVSNTAEERLAYTLARVGARAGHMTPDGLEVDIKNEDLASLADISIFTASRLLKRFERKGALEKHRGAVFIHSPEKLLVA